MECNCFLINNDVMEFIVKGKNKKVLAFEDLILRKNILLKIYKYTMSFHVLYSNNIIVNNNQQQQQQQPTITT